ncbi:Ulp2 SUMO deconjugation enzyme [Candida orthopsilosis Co 90-125]|uniref:Ulp2 SUMO deconjugation enzyme n=1 Tax=Candida orthopsilosis (strain 90-125) TaxID=1136231 RepID=H8WVW7_CANO9|nr:Ulp2 SUMO deconjugation enzyme [Candida orthopsilosis Co 90-125]CCG20591.1 Ulp2 SUMO deconjugation enzyme [Candida orthopsilosis Co 90-125]
MFDNPILDHERIYIQDDLSYNFSNHRDAKEIIPGDGLGGRLWSLISKMLHQITSLILSYFIRPRHIELPEHEKAPLNEESIASEDSDIEILGEKIKLHHYPITNDYHLITNHQRSYQNSILDDSFRDQMGNSTTTYENNTSQILRDLALKKLRANRAENKQSNRQQYGTDLSIASPLYRTPSSRVNNQLISAPQTHPTDLPTDLPIGHQFFNIGPKTNYQQSILNFYIPPQPVSITSYSLIDDLIANFKIDRISETYKKAQSKTQDLITAKRLASKTKIEPLNESQLTKVNQAWQSNPRSICINRYNIDISFADLQTLRDGRWLNDNIIDFYLNLVMKRNSKVFIWTTHFYSTLASRGYSGVARWAKRKKIDLFTMDKVIVPVNISNTHWALAVIDNLQKTITYYDSLDFNQSGNPEAVENLQMYMDNEAKRLGHHAIKYKLIPYIDAPQQKNGSDCGVFTCVAAQYLAQDKTFNYSQNDMKVIRRRMTYEIMNDELLK